MGKAASAIVVSVMLMMIVSLFSLLGGAARAANSQEYDIELVEHKVEVLYNGYIFLTDTVHLVGKDADPAAVISDFRIGFWHKYGDKVVRCMAYNSSSDFQVTPNVPLGDRMGFYAVEVTFPQALSVRNGTSHVFTVGFVLSNSLLKKQEVENTTDYILDFPAHPSLTKAVVFCNGSIVTPEPAVYVGGSAGGMSYNMSSLPAFYNSTATVTFVTDSSSISIIEIDELRRTITVNELGEISASDTYTLTNRMQTDLKSVELALPPNASSVMAEDQFGRRMADPGLISGSSTRYNTTLTLAVESNRSTTFEMKYSMLPTYLEHQQGSDAYVLTIPLFDELSYYVEQTFVAFILPEGARLQSFVETTGGNVYSLSKSVYQETLTVSRQGTISLDHFDGGITYSYSPVWLAFRPTMWMWVFALIVCACLVAVTRPQTTRQPVAPLIAVRLTSEHLRTFVDLYEEKLKIMLELDSLETRAEKGRITRRRYKVQRETLRTRLSTLDRTLGEYKQRLRGVGGHYSELMLQLEMAESELREVESGLRNDEIRHDQGELSLEAFKKRQDDYYSRKSKAEASISGILLRFREEIR